MAALAFVVMLILVILIGIFGTLLCRRVAAKWASGVWQLRARTWWRRQAPPPPSDVRKLMDEVRLETWRTVLAFPNGRRLVPLRFDVDFAPGDLELFGEMRWFFEAEMANTIEGDARRKQWYCDRRPTVVFHADPIVFTGRPQVHASFGVLTETMREVEPDPTQQYDASAFPTGVFDPDENGLRTSDDEEV